MALDTSGSDADSYATLVEAESYATNHFLGSDKTTWDGASNPDKEAALRQAAQYIDATFFDKFPGYLRSDSQSLQWPRTGAYDNSGRYLNGVPAAIKNAQIELAKERLVAGDNLVPVVERGGRIKSQTVGPITTTYADDADPVRVYRFAKLLLNPVLTGSGGRLKRV